MTQDKALTILQAGKNVFLTGEPGSGKTYTVNQFTKWCRSQGIKYAVTASTGIAATHINGMTIHSWCGLGIKEFVNDDHIADIASKPWLAKRILGTDVLIIDEVSMLNANTIDNIDRILSGVRGTVMSGQPFGGMQVVFVGDFFQLPPVSKTSKTSFAFESLAWEKCDVTYCYLMEQHRQNDPRFLEILTAMRNGNVDKDHLADLLKKKEGRATPKTILYTHNEDVDRLNNIELAKLEGEEQVFDMESEGVPYLVDMLKRSCLSPVRLVLKEGATVMFTRNNFDDGYVNGTIGIVTGFHPDSGMPIVQTKDGDTIVAKYAEWSIEDTVASISQIPLRLAWAITIHKSQGMSLDEAVVNLTKAFESGQGYVAISRVRSLDGLFLEGVNAHAFKMHPKVVIQDKIFRDKSALN